MLDADVLVVGGGPAGLAAAIAARVKGLRVMVADGCRPPISKACGEGLLPEAVEALCELGVTPGPQDGRALRGIRFQEQGVTVGAEFRKSLGLGMRREALHQKMIDRALACGVDLRWNAPVTTVGTDDAIVAGNKIKAKWVVGADGLRSRVRRWAGIAETHRSSNRFAWRRHYRAKPWSDFVEVHWDAQAQAYVTPVGEEEICVVVIGDRPKARLEPALRQFPELQQRLASAPLASVERGAVTEMGKLRRVTRRNVALVGDASGTVDAVTGQGLALGFQQAQALAEALATENLERYEQAHRDLLRRPWFMGNLLLLLSRRPGMRRRAFHALQAAPQLFEGLVGWHAEKKPLLELATAGAQCGWRFLTA